MYVVRLSELELSRVGYDDDPTAQVNGTFPFSAVIGNKSTAAVYFEVEPGNQLPLLVLAHGLSDSLEGCHEYGNAKVLNKEHRLILIDTRGHGASDKPHDPQAYGLEQMPADVVTVLDALGLDEARKVYNGKIDERPHTIVAGRDSTILLPQDTKVSANDTIRE